MPACQSFQPCVAKEQDTPEWQRAQWAPGEKSANLTAVLQNVPGPHEDVVLGTLFPITFGVWHLLPLAPLRVGLALQAFMCQENSTAPQVCLECAVSIIKGCRNLGTEEFKGTRPCTQGWYTRGPGCALYTASQATAPYTRRSLNHPC